MTINYNKKTIIGAVTIIAGILFFFFSQQLYDFFYYLGEMFGNAINN